MEHYGTSLVFPLALERFPLWFTKFWILARRAGIEQQFSSDFI